MYFYSFIKSPNNTNQSSVFSFLNITSDIFPSCNLIQDLRYIIFLRNSSTSSLSCPPLYTLYEFKLSQKLTNFGVSLSSIISVCSKAGSLLE